MLVALWVERKIMTQIVCINTDCIHYQNNDKCGCTVVGITKERQCDSHYPMPEILKKHLKEQVDAGNITS